MQAGSLKRHIDAPFLGKSVSQSTFVNHQNYNALETIKPIN